MAHAHIDYRAPAGLEETALGRIMRAKLTELLGAKLKWPAVSIKMALERAPAVRSLKRALLRRAPAVIAEIKRASPSAGRLREDFDASAIASEYRRAGAAALSVVTEAHYFQGTLETLARLRWSGDLPLLRKDFLVEPYQILEARHAGADAVLLIAALLDLPTLRNLRALAEEYGMEALVEVHDEEELGRALEAGATLIGVNNRNLRTLEVSLDVSLRLASKIPRGITTVSESGIRSAADARRLLEAGYNALLIGEQLLRAPSPGEALAAILASPWKPSGRQA